MNTLTQPAASRLSPQPGIVDLRPYEPGRPVESVLGEYGIDSAVKLASNENPLGPPPAVVELLQTPADLARYPDGGGTALVRRLAAVHDIDPARITLGNGSNDVLDLLCRVFCGPGRNAVMDQYCFVVYPISTVAAGGTVRRVAAVEFGHDLPAMAAAVDDDTRLLFIANPNNPTGTSVSTAALRTLLEQVPPHVVVVVDQAYHEYAQAAGLPDATAWLDEFDNLVVTRTFSKAHGLAGLRIGYALSSVEIADWLNRIRQPFNTSLLAQRAALAALDADDHVQRGVALNSAELPRVQAALQALGHPVIPSAGNFLTFDVGGPAAPVNEALLRQGVIVRPIAGYGLPDHLRVSIGLAEENDRFLRALEATRST